MDDAERANVTNLDEKRHLEEMEAQKKMKAQRELMAASAKRRRVQVEADKAASMERHMANLEQLILHDLLTDAKIDEYWCHVQASIYPERRYKLLWRQWGEHPGLASEKQQYAAACCKDCWNSLAFKFQGP